MERVLTRGGDEENAFPTLNEYIPNIPGALIYGLLQPPLVRHTRQLMLCVLAGGQCAIETPPTTSAFVVLFGGHC